MVSVAGEEHGLAGSEWRNEAACVFAPRPVLESMWRVCGGEGIGRCAELSCVEPTCAGTVSPPPGLGAAGAR